jgi:hypothetical protein
MEGMLAAGFQNAYFHRMSTLAEIEMAVPHLGVDELTHLERLIHALRMKKNRTRRSALDLPPLNLGRVLKPLNNEDDLLEEMLDDARD